MKGYVLRLLVGLFAVSTTTLFSSYSILLLYSATSFWSIPISSEYSAKTLPIPATICLLHQAPWLALTPWYGVVSILSNVFFASSICVWSWVLPLNLYIDGWSLCLVLSASCFWFSEEPNPSHHIIYFDCFFFIRNSIEWTLLLNSFAFVSFSFWFLSLF